MKVAALVLFLLGASNYGFTQKSGALIVEFEPMYASFRMDSLNASFTEQGAYGEQVFGLAPTETLQSGFGFSTKISIKPTSFLEVGLQGIAQWGSINRNITFNYVEPFTGDTMPVTGDYELKVNSGGLGVFSFVDLLSVFNSIKPKYLSLGTEAFIGLGFSHISDYYGFKEIIGPVEVNTLNYRSKDIFGRIGLKGSYVIDRGFVYRIGLSAGYQFYKTKYLTNSVTTSFPNIKSRNVQLDFSGIYLALHFGLGK